tara:strand:- start:414 stop:653 length:240 start_codon:yes stop_codon:yes gene_type:complete
MIKKVKKMLARRDVLIGILLGLIIYCAIRNCNIKEGYRKRGDKKKGIFKKIAGKIPSLSDVIAAPIIAVKNAKKKVKKA